MQIGQLGLQVAGGVGGDGLGFYRHITCFFFFFPYQILYSFDFGFFLSFSSPF